MEFDQSVALHKSISRRPSEGRRRNADRSIVTLEETLFPQFPVFAASGAVRLRTNRWWINDTETLLASRTTRLKNSESLRPNSSAINNVVSPRESNLLTLLLFAFNSSTGKFACFLDNFIIIDKIYRFLLFDGFVRIFDSQRKKKTTKQLFYTQRFRNVPPQKFERD